MLALHQKAGTSFIGEGATSVTLKGPGGFIQIDAGGVTIFGTLVMINVSGSPGSAPDAKPAAPQNPREGAVDASLKSGAKVARGSPGSAPHAKPAGPKNPKKGAVKASPKSGAKIAITSETVATSPTNRARVRVGVGEEVKLTVTPAPATWAITSGGGTLSPGGSQPTVTFTASDKGETVGDHRHRRDGQRDDHVHRRRAVELDAEAHARHKHHAPGRAAARLLAGLSVPPSPRTSTSTGWSGARWTRSTSGRAPTRAPTGATMGAIPHPTGAARGSCSRTTPRLTGRPTSRPTPSTRGTRGPSSRAGPFVTGVMPPFIVGAGHFPITQQWRVGTGTIHSFSPQNQEGRDLHGRPVREPQGRLHREDDVQRSDERTAVTEAARLPAAGILAILAAAALPAGPGCRAEAPPGAGAPTAHQLVPPTLPEPTHPTGDP